MTRVVVKLKHPQQMGAIFGDIARGIAASITAGVEATGKSAVPALKRATQDAKIRDLGDYERGWRWDNLRDFGKTPRGTIGVRVYNLRRYAVNVEMGRRPGAKPPPHYVLIGWVMRHLNPDSPAHAKQIAYLLAKAIGRRGIRGRPVLWRRGMLLRLRHIAKSNVDRAINAHYGVVQRKLVARGRP